MKRIFSQAWLWVLMLAAFAFDTKAQDNINIPFVPSPMIVVERMLQLAEVKKDDMLYDLGSGDGRIVIQAAKQYGIKGVGIDMNPELVERARANAEREGVSHLVEFRAADGLTVDISQATVVTLYMFKWFNNQMRPKLQRLKPGARIVAHDFDIDEWKPTKVETVDASSDSENYFSEPRTLYLWKIEAPSMAP
jgi:cyclopropane fatty-acyl-phospholipid synthase-like methyltransferase